MHIENILFKLLLFLLFSYSLCQMFQADEPGNGPPPVRKVNIDSALRKVFAYLTSLVPNLTVEDYMILEKMYAIPPAEALRYRKFITEAIVDEIFKVLTRPFEKDNTENIEQPIISNFDVIEQQLDAFRRR